jgi:hypothetical protein
MSAEETRTVILYTLSTFAQTCAALAAFVGALGLYKLQSLSDRRRDVEDELRILAGRLTAREADRIPHREVLLIVEAKQKEAGKENDVNVVEAADLHRERAALTPLLARSSRALLAFETWNLVVIGLALVGFNYVSALAVCPVTFWAIWVAALGTVGVTGYAVYTWTRG